MMGEFLRGSLTLSGSTLYGMTSYGGTHYHGTIFKINTDGTGFQLLHSFEKWSKDGGDPRGSLTLSGSTLYGMNDYGGTDGNGTIFKINTDGTGSNSCTASQVVRTMCMLRLLPPVPSPS